MKNATATLETLKQWGRRELPALPYSIMGRISLTAALVISGLALATCNLLIVQYSPSHGAQLNWLMGLLGVGLVGLAWQKHTSPTRQLPDSIKNPLTAMATWLGNTPAQVVFIFGAPALAASVGILAMPSHIELPLPWLAAGGWIMSILMLILGGLSLPETGQRPRLGAILGLIGLFALGLAPRLFFLDAVPVAWTGDEGSSAMNAISLVTGKLNNIFSGGWHGFASFYFIIQSIPIAFLGRSIEAARLSSAIAGALTVPLIYLLGQAMFGKRAGLLAAILLTGAHLHLHFSRIGLNNIWDGLWYTGVLAALWVAWKQENRNAFVLAGVGLGMAQYFYPSARMLVVIALVWLALNGLQNRQKFWRLLPDIAIMLLAGLVVTLPMLMYFSMRLQEYLGPINAQAELPDLIRRATETNTSLPLIILQEISQGLRAFIQEPLIFWYRAQVPILRAPEAALFLLGAASLIILRLRDERTHLLALWVLAFGIIGGLSESTPAAQRYVAAAPVAVLLAAIGLETLARAAQAITRPTLHRWISLVAIGLAVSLCINDAWFYFREYAPNSYYTGKYDMEGEGGIVARQMARYMRTQPGDYIGVMVGYPRLGFYTVPSSRYLAPQITGVSLNYPWGDPQNPPLFGKKFIFVLLSDKINDLQAIRQAYPNGYLTEIKGELSGQTAFWLYQTPAPNPTPNVDAFAPIAVFSQPAAWILAGLLALVLALCLVTLAWLKRFAPNPSSLPQPERALFAPRWKWKWPASPIPLPVHNGDAPHPPVSAESLPPCRVEVSATEAGAARISVEIPLGASAQIVVESWPPEGEHSARVVVNAHSWPSRAWAGASALESARQAPGRLAAWAKNSWGQAISGEAFPLLWVASILLYLAMVSVQIENFPIYFFTDEAVHMNHVAELVSRGFKSESGEFLPTYFSLGPSFSLNSVSVYVQLLPYLLLGKSVLVTRMVSALITLLGAVAVGLTLRQVFGSKTAWAGILFLITSAAWFLHARTAFEYMELSAFYAMFLYAYTQYRQGKPVFLIGAMVTGALAFYTHGLGQMLMGVTGLLLFLTDLRFHWRPENRRMLMISAVMGVILLAPFARYQLQNPMTIEEQIRQRGSYLFDNQLTAWAKTLRFWDEYSYGLNPFYWFAPETNDLIRHKMAGYSHIWIGTLPFLLIGLGVALKNIRKGTHRALLVALLATPVPATLVEIGVTRMLWFIVPVALLAGLGLDAALSALARWRVASRRGLALGAFALMAAYGLFMFSDALRNGPTWYQDYTLYGMQYGAKQVFQDVVMKRLKEDPEAYFVISPNWANGTDQMYQFFIPPEYRTRAVIGSVYDMMERRVVLPQGATLIAIPDEYQKALESNKFKLIEQIGSIPYPNGADGFILMQVEYADSFEEILAQEAQARRVPVTETIDIHGVKTRVTYSQIDMGELAKLFDDDLYSLIRGTEANPFLLDFHFAIPQTLNTLFLKVGSMDRFTVTIRMYATPDAAPVEISEQYIDLGRDPQVEIVLDNAPASIARMEISIYYETAGESAKIHIWEVTLK